MHFPNGTMPSAVCAIALFVGCRPDAPFDGAVRNRDVRAVVDALGSQDRLGPPGALGDWFGRHPPSTRFHVSGPQFGAGELRGRLGARIEATPGRWSDDHWPLGAVRYTDSGIEDIAVSSAPRRIAGAVDFEPVTHVVTGRVTLDVRERIVTFALGTNGSTPLLVVATCDGQRVPLTWNPWRAWWAATLPTDSCRFELHYQLFVRSAGFDRWDTDALVLRRKSWLPAPLDRSWPTAVDVTLTGLEHLKVRGATSLSRRGTEWTFRGRSDGLQYLVARADWITKRGASEAIDLEVAIAEDDDPRRLAQIWERATEAIRATKRLGTMPARIQVTEVPKGRAPLAAIDQIALPRDRLSSHPLALAHEMVHIAQGPHHHRTFGLPSIEEALAEHLALRAARTPNEAYLRRRTWQHLMREREGNDGRPLHDSLRLPVAQYYRGALILDALSRRIGEDALSELVSPLDGAGVAGWADLVTNVEAAHPDVSEWLRTLVAAKDLPEIGVEVDQDGLRLVDVGQTGVAMTIDIRWGPGVHDLTSVRLGERLGTPPDGANYVIVDPEAHAPIRRAGSWTGRFELP